MKVSFSPENQKLTLLLVFAGFILSSAAFYNGYPLIYSDTGTYIHSGFEPLVPIDRPITYGLFVRHISMGFSLWFVIIAQGIIVAYCIWLLLKDFFPSQRLRFSLYLFTIILLTAFTSLSWYSAQVMPDVYSALLIITIALMLFGERNLFRNIALSAFCLFFLMVHYSHLLIGMGCLAAFSLIWLLFRNVLDINWRRFIIPLSLVAIAWVAVPTLHAVYGAGFTLSRGSHVLLIARNVENGILKQFLNEKCGKAGYEHVQFCNYIDDLPPQLDMFLWRDDSPLQKTGGWEDSKEEYNFLLMEMLKDPKYLWKNITAGIRATFTQLWDVSIGSGLGHYGEAWAPYGQVHWRFNDELPIYNLSKQNHLRGNQLDFKFLNQLQFLFLVFSSLLLSVVYFSKFLAVRVNPKLFLLTICLLIGIFINALFTAGLHNSYDRFQGRVIWLMPLVALLIMYQFLPMIKRKLFIRNS